MSQELLQRYGMVLRSLSGLKIYNALIIILGLLAYHVEIKHFHILFTLLIINSLINYILFKKMCNYLDRLNKLFTNM